MNRTELAHLRARIGVLEAEVAALKAQRARGSQLPNIVQPITDAPAGRIGAAWGIPHVPLPPDINGSKSFRTK